MLLRDAADVPDVHDLPLVPHHAHRDGVLAHLRRNVAVHLNAQVLQHQKPCASQQKAQSPGHLQSPGLCRGALWPARHMGRPQACTLRCPVSCLTSFWVKLKHQQGHRGCFMPRLICFRNGQGRERLTRQEGDPGRTAASFWVAFSLLLLHLIHTGPSLHRPPSPPLQYHLLLHFSPSFLTQHNGLIHASPHPTPLEAPPVLRKPPALCVPLHLIRAASISACIPNSALFLGGNGLRDRVGGLTHGFLLS